MQIQKISTYHQSIYAQDSIRQDVLTRNNTIHDTYTMSEEAKKMQLDQVNLDEYSDEPLAEESTPKYELSEKDRDRLAQYYRDLNENWVTKDMLLKNTEHANSQAQAYQEEAKAMKKCLNIARNMGKGMRVSPVDEQYLLQHNSVMYQTASNARVLVEKQNEKAKTEVTTEDLERTKRMENPATGDDVPDRAQYAEIPIMEAIGEVLMNEAPLSSLSGMIDLGTFDGASLS